MAMHFEDFQVGDEFVTSARTIAEADIVNFAGVSGDFNPLHTDVEYARSVGFEGRLAHGALVFSVVTGLIARMGLLEGTAVAFLELTWRFKGPVLSGDTIRARLTTRELRPTKRTDRGVLIRDIAVLNQRDEVVQEGTQTLLVLRRAAEEATA